MNWKKRHTVCQKINSNWERFEETLRGKGPKTFSTLRAGANPSIFTRLEAQFNFLLPDSFKAFYLRHDGQEANDETPGVFDWFFLPLLSSNGECVLDEWRNALKLVHVEPYGKYVGPVRRQTWNERWVPFAIDYQGNCLCFDFDPAFLGRRGQIICLDYDLNKTSVLAKNIQDFLANQSKRLETGQRVIEERNIQSTWVECVEVLRLEEGQTWSCDTLDRFGLTLQRVNPQLATYSEQRNLKASPHCFAFAIYEKDLGEEKRFGLHESVFVFPESVQIVADEGNFVCQGHGSLYHQTLASPETPVAVWYVRSQVPFPSDAKLKFQLEYREDLKRESDSEIHSTPASLHSLIDEPLSAE